MRGVRLGEEALIEAFNTVDDTSIGKKTVAGGLDAEKSASINSSVCP